VPRRGEVEQQVFLEVRTQHEHVIERWGGGGGGGEGRGTF
jgi:hypothetical protein